MTSRFRCGATGVVLVLAIVLGALATSADGARTASPAARASSTALLVGIRSAHTRGFDRVVFEFAGPVPSRRTVGYVDRLIGDLSGLPVQIAGRAILRVSFRLAQAHNDAGKVTAPSRIAIALTNVMAVVHSGDFEGPVVVVRHRPEQANLLPRVHADPPNPSRVVIDTSTTFPTVLKRVYFFNQPGLRPTNRRLSRACCGECRRAAPRPGSAAKIDAVLKNGGYTFTFTPPVNGTLVVAWYHAPTGARVTAAAPKPTLIARGNADFFDKRESTITTTLTLTLTLTIAGRRALQTARTLKLTPRAPSRRSSTRPSRPREPSRSHDRPIPPRAPRRSSGLAPRKPGVERGPARCRGRHAGPSSIDFGCGIKETQA
jgi:hypothetical protein